MSRRAGFTLIEVTVAMAILAMIGVTVFGVMSRVQVYQAQMMALADLHAQTRLALDRVVRIVREGKHGTMVPGTFDPSFSSYVSFSRPVPGAAIAYETVEIRFAPAQGEVEANDADDNHNGYVDEGNLVYVRADGGTSVLASNVPELNPENPSQPGVRFSWSSADRCLRIGLTLQRRIGTGEVVTWSEETSVLVRNK